MNKDSNFPLNFTLPKSRYPQEIDLNRKPKKRPSTAKTTSKVFKRGIGVSESVHAQRAKYRYNPSTLAYPYPDPPSYKREDFGESAQIGPNMGEKHILSTDNLLHSAPKINVFLLKGTTNGNYNLGQGVEEYFHREFNDHDHDDADDRSPPQKNDKYQNSQANILVKTESKSEVFMTECPLELLKKQSEKSQEESPEQYKKDNYERRFKSEKKEFSELVRNIFEAEEKIKGQNLDLEAIRERIFATEESINLHIQTVNMVKDLDSIKNVDNIGDKVKGKCKYPNYSRYSSGKLSTSNQYIRNENPSKTSPVTRYPFKSYNLMSTKDSKLLRGYNINKNINNINKNNNPGTINIPKQDKKYKVEKIEGIKNRKCNPGYISDLCPPIINNNNQGISQNFNFLSWNKKSNPLTTTLNSINGNRIINDKRTFRSSSTIIASNIINKLTNIHADMNHISNQITNALGHKNTRIYHKKFNLPHNGPKTNLKEKFANDIISQGRYCRKTFAEGFWK